MNRRTKPLITLLCIISAVLFCALSAYATETDIVNSEEPIATNIYIVKAANCKTKYDAGDYFDPTGFRMLVTCSNAESFVIQPHQLQYLQTGPLTTEDTVITFYYQHLTYDIPITVTNNRRPVEIELQSTKTEYLALEKINASDFTVALLYSDGTTEPIDLSLCKFYPELGSAISAYDKTIEVSYTLSDVTYTDSVNVTVSPILLADIQGVANAFLYESAEPSLPEGLTVTAYYNGYQTISQVITDFVFSYEYDYVKADENGKTRIKLILDSKTVDIEVNVLPIVGYNISGLKNAYYYGDSFSASDVRVYATYSDGTSSNITSQITIDAPEIITASSKITASHNGYDLKDFLKISTPEGTLTVINQPNKLQYEVGEIFDSTGLSLAIEYTDGHRVLLFPNDYALNCSAPLTKADKFVTAEYFGAKTNISISVGDEAYIVSLSIIGSPDVLNYYEGHTLNTSGLLIQANFSDGTSSIIDHRNLTFIPALNTPLTTDITSVTISANDGTDKYCEVVLPITVAEKHPTVLVATSQPNKLVYAEGEIFDPDGLALSLIFNDMSSIVPSSFSFDPELGSPIILRSNATEKYIIHAIYEYEGVEYTYPIEITVTPAEVENLIVLRPPSKVTYEIGDPFDPSGLELILVYKDRSLTSPKVPAEYYSFSPSIITNETREITVTFRDLTLTIPIVVNGAETSEPDVTTEPEPPVTSEPEVTTEPNQSTDEETTAEPVVTTEPETSEPETSEPEVTTESEISTSPEEITTDGETTTEPNIGDKDKVPSLLSLWIIVIVVIVAALIALIIYYKKNFT